MSRSTARGAARGRLLLAAGLSGAAVMIVELTATRSLAPAFGASIYTWTNVIGVVLLALTLGYATGGVLADRWPRASVLAMVMVGGALLALPAPFLSVPLGVWLQPEPAALTPVTATGHVVRGSLAVTVLLFAPPVFLLGMVGPFTTRLLVDSGLAGGSAAGRTLAASTLGSLVGTYLPAHVLIEELGVRNTLLVAVVLPVLGALLLGARRTRLAGVACLGLIAGLMGLASGLPVRPELDPGVFPPGTRARELEVVEELESPYQYVRITEWSVPDGEDQRQLRLSVDEGVMEYQSVAPAGGSGESPADLKVRSYYDTFTVLPELVAGSRRRPVSVVVVGGGAGTMARLLREHQDDRVARVVNVEIDPVVAAQASRFGWTARKPDVDLVGDGRVVLRALEGPFDVIILDAYAHQVTIPFHLATREFFELVRARLSSRGLVALNVSVHDLEAPLALALRRTLGTVFPRVEAVSVPGTWNVMLLAYPDASRRSVAADGPGTLEQPRDVVRGRRLRLPDPGLRGMLLTDDRAPTEHLARQR